nr:PREDICTED: uncharacterized protein LOC104050036 [Phalacrocorax carbo]
MDLRPIPYESIPPSLTALELSYCEIPAAWFCSSAGRTLPQLQHLVVHKVPAFSNCHLLNYRITDTGIQAAAPHLELLEHLVLHDCRIGDSAMDFVGRHLKHLRFLKIESTYPLTNIESTYPLTNVGLACLATLQRLETLCLDVGHEIPPSAIIALCQALPQLKNLKLGRACFEDGVIDKIQPHPAAAYVHIMTSKPSFFKNTD